MRDGRVVSDRFGADVHRLCATLAAEDVATAVRYTDSGTAVLLLGTPAGLGAGQ